MLQQVTKKSSWLSAKRIVDIKKVENNKWLLKHQLLFKNMTKLFSLAKYHLPRQPMARNGTLNKILPLLKRWTMNECKQRLCVHAPQLIENFQVLRSILYWKEEYFFFLRSAFSLDQYSRHRCFIFISILPHRYHDFLVCEPLWTTNPTLATNRTGSVDMAATGIKHHNFRHDLSWYKPSLPLWVSEYPFLLFLFTVDIICARANFPFGRKFEPLTKHSFCL